MNQKLLDLKPTRYLCPYCGEWHDWGLEHKLEWYHSRFSRAGLRCKRQFPESRDRKVYFYFTDGYCYCKTLPTCSRGYLDIENAIHIEDIVESSEEPRVTFDVLFFPAHTIGRGPCSDCPSNNTCVICKLADENGSLSMHITFGFEFEQSDYEKISDTFLLALKKKVQELEQALKEQEG